MFKKKLIEYSLPIIIVTSIVLIAIYFLVKFYAPAFYSSYETVFETIHGLSFAILGSGIFLASLKWFQFMGFFREELNKIISSSEFDKKLENAVNSVFYSDAFLSKRNDLPDLWSRVNKALFKNQFSRRAG